VSRRSDNLRDEAELRALRLIKDDPGITQRALAEELGISLGAAHYIVRAFLERGLVKLARFSASQNKRGYAYVLTPKGMAEKAAIAGRFLVRKREEYDILRREIEELSAELRHDADGSEASQSFENSAAP
jgi:EPS-associated MarR family transcriptional regulator